jgi:hypothetical protein
MLLEILIGVAVVVYLFARRLAGEPLAARRLVVMPAAVTIWGGYQLLHTHGGLGTVDLMVVVIAAAASLALGVARGATIRVFVRDGQLWQRYTFVTIGVWLLSVVIRLGIDWAGHLAGAGTSVLTSSLVLSLGVSFLGEAAVVGTRGLRHRAPFAPRDARRVARASRLSS